VSEDPFDDVMVAGVDSEATIRRVGAVVREARTQRRMTLNDLAGETGVSVSMLSMLERGVASPSIGTLVSVASALGLHMSELFGSHELESASPVRRLQDQVQYESADGARRRVIHTNLARGLEMSVNEYEPGTSSSSHEVHHNGSEFGVVLSGTLIVTVGGVEHTLRAGDGITYPSSTPHRIANEGRTRARAAWVNLD
jgi:transcriptional regulator with XRE-family HTH domain